MNPKPTIEILDSIHCYANKEARKIIKHALSYKKVHWRQGQFQKKSKTNTQHLISGRDGSGGHFLTGLLSKVKKYCKELNIQIEIIGSLEKLRPQAKPSLKGIKFRPDQVKALQRIKRHQFGRIIHPTGTGKTIIEMGIVSMFPNCYILLLAHTRDLAKQLSDAAEEFLPEHNIYTPQGGEQINNAISNMADRANQGYYDGILITTIQSFAKLDPNQYMHLFDVTIVDESHHISSEKSQYGKVMTHNLSPRRYGFTATLPTKDDQLLFNEGILGPVIANLSIKDAIKNNLVAIPKIKLVNVPYDPELNKQCSNRYFKYAELCIATNKKRNALICSEAADAVKNKKPVLVIIEKIEHGKLLQQKMLKSHNLKVPFASGVSSQEERLKYKQDLIGGKILCVIVSRIWMEGINIQNLEVIIYAAAMKEKKRVIQAMGRGLRTSKDKDEILLIDFLDPYKYLSEHSILRIQTYNEMGWL